MFIGSRVRELRRAKGLTQQQLADMINVTKVSICCYEKGTRFPNIDTFCDLVTTLQTTPSYLLGMDVLVDNEVSAENEEPYVISIQKEELELIKELRNYPKAVKEINENPKRFAQRINSRL